MCEKMPLNYIMAGHVSSQKGNNGLSSRQMALTSFFTLAQIELKAVCYMKAFDLMIGQ